MSDSKHGDSQAGQGKKENNEMPASSSASSNEVMPDPSSGPSAQSSDDNNEPLGDSHKEDVPPVQKEKTNTNDAKSKSVATGDDDSAQIKKQKDSEDNSNMSDAEKIVSIGEEADVQGVNILEGDENMQAGRDANKYSIHVSNPSDAKRILESLQAPFSSNPMRLRPPAPKNLPQVSTKEIVQWYQRLQEDRLVVIECLDQDLVLAAADGLVKRLEINDPNRHFSFYPDELSAKEAGEDTYGWGIKLFTDNPCELPSGSTVIVDLMAANTQRGTERGLQFLDSIRRSSRGYSEQIRHELTVHNLYVICMTQSGAPVDVDLSPLFSPWRLDFLEPILRHAFADEDFDELLPKLKTIRHAGTWGPEQEFYIHLRREIRSGHLKQQVKTTTELDQSCEKDQLEELFNLSVGENPLHRLVLYIATFFPGLSPLDFDLMFRRLAGDDEMEITRESEFTTKKGKIKHKTEVMQQRLTDQWSAATADRIQRECRLQAISSPESSERVIDFQSPWMRMRLREHMEQWTSSYLAQMAERVRLSGFLFDGPPNVIQGIVMRVKEMALDYPDYHGKGWLFGMIDEIVLSIFKESAEDPDFDEFIRLIRKSQFQFSRLSYLIRAMLDDSRLHRLVDGFFEQLLTGGFFFQSLLLFLLRSLRSAPGFDTVYWSRQLLERGPGVLEGAVYDALLQHLVWEETRAYRLLEDIWKWIPEDATKSASTSHSVALKLTVDVCKRFALNFPEHGYGKKTQRYPFLCNDAGELETESLDHLIQVLLRSDLTKHCTDQMSNALLLLVAKWTLNSKPSDLQHFRKQPLILGSIHTPRQTSLTWEQQTAIFFIAAYTAEWYMIATGLDENIAESTIAIDTLLSSFLDHADKQLQGNIVRAWRSLRGIFMQKDLLPIRRRDKEGRRLLKARRAQIGCLIDRFHELRNDRKARGVL